MATFHCTIRSFKPGKALQHNDYIMRRGKRYTESKKNDLMYAASANLPEWASRSSRAFFRAADQFGRKNAAVCRELEIALPNELTLEQNKVLLMEFVRSEIGNKPVALAIHAPMAALSGGQQIHAHVIYSDRQPDGIARTPDQFFRRYNSKTPSSGGCKKDGCGMNALQMKLSAQNLRKNVADTINKHLALNGYATKVDHRSLKDQGIDRQPERHLGSMRVGALTADGRAKIVASRRARTDASA